MPSDGEESDPVDWDLMDKFADDSMRLLQLNLVILTVFLSAIALNNQNIDTEYINQLASSIYTLTAVSLWVGSLLGSLFVYRSARRTMLKDEYTNRIAYRDELVHINLIIASAGSSVFAVLIFITGIIDRSYSN